MSMRRTWAVFTCCDGYPVLVDRWQSRAAALRAAEHLSSMGARSYQVIEQLLPDHARIFRNDPACNPSDAGRQPRLPTGIKIEVDKDGSRS